MSTTKKLTKAKTAPKKRVVRKITVRTLEKYGACPGQMTLFKETFGRSAALTPANVRKALKAGLDISWFSSVSLAFDAWLKPAGEVPRSEAEALTWLRLYRNPANRERP